MNHRFWFSTSGNPTKHMPIGYWSLWGQPRSVTSGDLRWPWNSCDARSRATASHVLTLITSTIPIKVNRTTPSCVYSRFRWNLAEGCSLCDVITSWPDLTWRFFSTKSCAKDSPYAIENFCMILQTVWRAAQKISWGVASTPPPLAMAKAHPKFFRGF